MNLYLISQEANSDYDTYDSAVVAAESEGAAKRIHPSANIEYPIDKTVHEQGQRGSWAFLSEIKVRLIGVADPSIKKEEVICSSYNAG